MSISSLLAYYGGFLAVVLAASWLVRHQRRWSARRRAVRVLQGHRPSADGRWWPRDWAWAYRTVGTPEALEMAATIGDTPRMSPRSATLIAALDGSAAPVPRQHVRVERGGRTRPRIPILGAAFGISAFALISDPSLGAPRYVVAFFMLALCVSATHTALTERQPHGARRDTAPETERLP